MTIYIASKCKHANKWKRLRDEGYPIISTWIDESEPNETNNLTDLWIRCINEASQADVLILYYEENEHLKGALVEMGAALASGKQVYVVGLTKDYSIINHPLVKICENIIEAFSYTKRN